jgi:choline dehydrogenase
MTGNMYDYIVVGAGTAGCVLASRLSRDPGAQVLLLEAGDAEPPDEVAIPPAWPTLQGTRADWGGLIVPMAEAGVQGPWPRGRGLGGSTNINGMMFARGHRSSYDRWAKDGAAGWDFDSLLPYFKRSETAAGRSGDWRGTEGPMTVAPASEPNPVTLSLLEAAVEAGYSRAADVSSGMDEGVGLADLNVVDGRRQTAADGYLRPVMGRANLDVVTGALCSRVRIARGRCTGVEYIAGGKSHAVGCSGEVILAAGTIGSAQLLLLSGVGPAGHLAEAGIDVAADLPGVGANLHDHPLTSITYASSRPVPPSVNNHGEALGLIHSGEDTTGGPDLQVLFGPFPYFPPGLPGPHPGAGYSIALSLMTPRSRGSMRLASSDPAAPPVVNPGYLSDRRDLDTLAAGLELVREIGLAPSIRAWRAEECVPGSDADLRAYLRAHLLTYFHYVGTCRIGPDPMAVVDTELRVRGVAGLRVADASVIPSVPSANTNATVYAIAERAADLISHQSS